MRGREIFNITKIIISPANERCLFRHTVIRRQFPRLALSFFSSAVNFPVCQDRNKGEIFSSDCPEPPLISVISEPDWYISHCVGRRQGAMWGPALHKILIRQLLIWRWWITAITTSWLQPLQTSKLSYNNAAVKVNVWSLKNKYLNTNIQYYGYWIM